MGKFEKGNKGRPKGSKNKFKAEMRERIQTLFDDNCETIQKDLDGLDSKDRLKFLTDLFPYLVPKLQAGTLKHEGLPEFPTQPPQINVYNSGPPLAGSEDQIFEEK
ncbi:MAG: hypothetical protein WD555_03760 [Fulvivirga sp.]